MSISIKHFYDCVLECVCDCKRNFTIFGIFILCCSAISTLTLSAIIAPKLKALPPANTSIPQEAIESEFFYSFGIFVLVEFIYSIIIFLFTVIIGYIYMKGGIKKEVVFISSVYRENDALLTDTSVFRSNINSADWDNYEVENSKCTKLNGFCRKSSIKQIAYYIGWYIMIILAILEGIAVICYISYITKYKYQLYLQEFYQISYNFLEYRFCWAIFKLTSLFLLIPTLCICCSF